jgi:hypothetical protein
MFWVVPPGFGEVSEQMKLTVTEIKVLTSIDVSQGPVLGWIAGSFVRKSIIKVLFCIESTPAADFLQARHVLPGGCIIFSCLSYRQDWTLWGCLFDDREARHPPYQATSSGATKMFFSKYVCCHSMMLNAGAEGVRADHDCRV